MGFVLLIVEYAQLRCYPFFIELPYLTSQSHRLHYQTAGLPSRPAVLLLHGFLGNHRDFDSVVESLESNFYCILPDLPGHGRTQTQAGQYTFEATAQSLLSLLDHLHCPQVNLLGYSLGGRLALYMACQFPSRLLSLMLESASPGLETAAERQERVEKDEAIAHQLTTLPLQEFVNRWYANPLFASLQNHPEVYATMLKRRCQLAVRSPTSSIELAQALRGFSLGRQPSLWHRLPSFSNPLLLLAGELDAKFVAINREILSRCTPAASAKLEIFKQCGHNIHLENPTAYSRTLRQFLMAIAD
jgi:2-succinyl-6-hydroxy-2,4-cyclohexadiene-1-carboxylate synthase